ncbi:hypothetical protein [Streptomyces sp. NPDC055036]
MVSHRRMPVGHRVRTASLDTNPHHKSEAFVSEPLVAVPMTDEHICFGLLTSADG